MNRLFLTVATLLVLLPWKVAETCTVGCAMGNATADGRPFSWKNRDGSGRHAVWFVTSNGTYDYLALGTGGGLKMGVNEAGLSLQNSLITDIPSPGFTYENNTAFKAYCLSELATVEQVRQAIVEDTDGVVDHWPPPSICVNFSDAQGRATNFELGAEIYYEYDPTDPGRLVQFPKQFVARANASHQNPDHTDDASTGGNRYVTARDDLQSAADDGGLDVSGWINQVARHGEPGVDSVEMPSREATHAVMLVHGANGGEDPRTVTAWIALGNPDYTCFLPVWAAQRDVLSPRVTSDGLHDSIAGIAEQLFAKHDDNQYDLYVNDLIRPIEDNIIDAVTAARKRWLVSGFDLVEATRIHMEASETAWKTMSAMNAGAGRNLNETPHLTGIETEVDGLQVAFDCLASDDDGSIVAYDWNFGDGSISSIASPIHTYSAAGTYLVRCRVTDDEGSCNSRWKYVTVSREAPIQVVLEDIDSGSTSPEGLYRWMDTADQLYADAYRDVFDYTQASVVLTYFTAASTLHGSLTAAHLKPNFTYQMKLVGAPGTYPNELIGLTGRWWQEEWTGEEWGNGQNLNNKGDGSSPNPNDQTYFARRDVPDPDSPTGKRYRFTGYLMFDHFITDDGGNASVDFEQRSSYHVLWKSSQRARQAQDGPIKTTTFEVELPDPVAAYDTDYPERTVSVYGEWERLPVGGVTLPTGNYSATFMLTEESFHGSGLAGGWAAAMGAQVNFGLVSGPEAQALGPRYLSITPPASASSVALRVESPAVPCLPRYVDPAGRLVDQPVFRSSHDWGTVIVADREIVPSTTYEVRADLRVDGEPVNLSNPVSVTTWTWGNTNRLDDANLFDILCVLDGSRGVFTHCSPHSVDLMGEVPDGAIDDLDISAVLDAFRSLPYPASPCPD